MDYKEALKLAIDGEVITDGTVKIYMRDGVFFFESYLGNISHGFGFYFQHNPNGWQIYRPQPKFTQGELFCNTKGDIGKVLSVHDDHYIVTFNLTNPTNKRYTEDNMVKLEVKHE